MRTLFGTLALLALVGCGGRGSSPAETTCGCTDIDYSTQPVGVGDTARVEVRFDSQGFYGWQFKRVRLYTTADVSPLTIYVEAEVE